MYDPQPPKQLIKAGDPNAGAKIAAGLAQQAALDVNIVVTCEGERPCEDEHAVVLTVCGADGERSSVRLSDREASDIASILMASARTVHEVRESLDKINKGTTDAD